MTPNQELCWPFGGPSDWTKLERTITQGATMNPDDCKTAVQPLLAAVLPHFPPAEQRLLTTLAASAYALGARDTLRQLVPGQQPVAA